MALLNMHPRAELLRYLDGAVTADERRTLEAHLASCKQCRDYIARVKNFNEGLAGLTEEEFTSREPCPDSWTLASYDAGEVDEETARHLRAHLLYCDECAEEFDALRRLHGPSWTKAVVRAARGMLECLSLTGSGMLLEPAYARVRAAEGRVADHIQIEDTVADPETKTTSTVRVRIEADPKGPLASVLLELEPPAPAWRAYLLGAEDEEVASLPLAERETVLGTSLPYGAYTVSLRKGKEELASFAIEIRGA